MNNLQSLLKENRKTLKQPVAYLKKEQLATFKEVGGFPCHDSTKPGVLDVDIHQQRQNFILSGGRDGKAVLFDIQTKKIVKKIDASDK